MSAVPPKVAFVHIPRTAGTTFGKILDNLYKEKKVARFYADEHGNVANDEIGRFRNLDAETKNSYDLLRGHFVFGFDQDLKGFRYVTLLRDPVQRLISYYFYALQDRTNYLHAYLMQRRIPLEDFLTSGLSIELDNYQVRAISGAAFSSTRERVTHEHYELAKRNLAKRFASFGLIERFGESIAEFSRLFGWRIADFQPHNLGSYSKDLELSKGAMETLVAANRFDIDLYAYARDLFEARLADSFSTTGSSRIA
jgi:hypothetical protein